jgi:Flp pilus assembly protein CpaB
MSDGALHTVPYPEAALPPGYVRSDGLTEQEYREVFTSALQPAQVVVAQDFGPKSDASSILVPPPGNYVEIGVPVCQSAAVSGYIGPGSTVAVYDTAGTRNPMQSSCSSHAPPGGGTKTFVVATNLEVLSVQGAPPQGSPSGTAISPGTGESECSGMGVMCVTLAVPTGESLKLADAAATGDLTLVMMTGTTKPLLPGTTYKSP